MNPDKNRSFFYHCKAKINLNFREGRAKKSCLSTEIPKFLWKNSAVVTTNKILVLSHETTWTSNNPNKPGTTHKATST